MSEFNNSSLKKTLQGAIAVALAFSVSINAVNAADAPASAPAATEAAAQSGPAELVTNIAQQTLKDLDAHRSEYKNDPKKLRSLVDKNLLPYFDSSYAGQLVLGKYWRDANPDQRKRFVDAFYQSLLQTYGEALTDFTPDRLKILPYQGNPQETVATVRSEVRRDDGSKVPVNYSLHKTAQGWKAFDVQISGVSYVKSMRTDFGSEVQQKGLDAVIQRLESQVASGQPAVPKPGSSAK
jgi:phospholipid transport system substrate-binding protein